ncbi:MAG: hypothetical protein ACNS60_11730 [Candidatus Cyclobacteriaceae bacterium M2_1C_046]
MSSSIKKLNGSKHGKEPHQKASRRARNILIIEFLLGGALVALLIMLLNLFIE